MGGENGSSWRSNFGKTRGAGANRFVVVTSALLKKALPARAQSRCARSPRPGGGSHYGKAPTRAKFAADSSLEGDGFEPSAPHKKQPFLAAPFGPAIRLPQQNRVFRAGDRWFESISLRQPVCVSRYSCAWRTKPAAFG